MADKPTYEYVILPTFEIHPERIRPTPAQLEAMKANWEEVKADVIRKLDALWWRQITRYPFA